MAHAFDSGMFHRNPAWHGLGNVTQEWPGSFNAARKLAGLEWEPVPEQVYRRVDQVLVNSDDQIVGDAAPTFELIEGWKRVVRNDNDYTLTIQEDSYKIIDNTAFGEVIQEVMALEIADLKYETLISIYGGRMIVATMWLNDPVSINGDPSKTYRYIVFVSRHDGQGGLRVIFTDIRVVCANTMGMAERQGKTDGSSFSIRHTANWELRVSQMRDMVSLAVKDSKAWADLANSFVAVKLGKNTTTRYLSKFLPTNSAMTDRQVGNAKRQREVIRNILASPTCEGVSDNLYGLVMASTEWNDHVRRAHSLDSRVQRTLLRPEPYKIKAVQIAKELAKVK